MKGGLELSVGSSKSYLELAEFGKGLEKFGGASQRKDGLNFFKVPQQVTIVSLEFVFTGTEDWVFL